MSVLPDSARAVLESDALAHLVTVKSHGRAAIEEGGAPEVLQELARTYLGPGVEFPRMPDPPPGFRLRIAVERIGGIGPWTEAS